MVSENRLSNVAVVGVGLTTLLIYLPANSLTPPYRREVIAAES